jgi:ubiquinone/menaquinone biosynthesis C-methylase UbiE
LEIQATGDTGLLKNKNMPIEGFTITDNIYFQEWIKPDIIFESSYIELRRKENRLYNDEELSQLPLIVKNHPHHGEWLMRKRSCNRLLHHLQKKQSPQKILEVGCGNGWLAHRLAGIPGCKVIGTDINFTELQQAARVFSHIPNLQFIYCDIHSEILASMEFDCIVLASCIQYFSSLPDTIQFLLGKLKQNGEIHILDSPFYKSEEIDKAKQRTMDYYRELGFPEMANYYFHHPVTALAAFEYEMLYQPSPLQHYLLQNKNPFPWLCIKNKPVPA